MSWMQFTIELLDKLAWPLVLVFAVVSLKRPISKLIPLAKKLKFKDLELEFGQELKAVTQEAEAIFPELKLDKRNMLIVSASKLPNSAVIEAWETVDLAAEKLIHSHCSNITLDKNTRYKHIENILISEQLISTKQGKLFSELRQLRNKVAHAVGYEVDKTQAVQYIELCFKLIDHLHGLTPSTLQVCQTSVSDVAS